jgi:hypothetical protein
MSYIGGQMHLSLFLYKELFSLFLAWVSLLYRGRIEKKLTLTTFPEHLSRARLVFHLVGLNINTQQCGCQPLFGESLCSTWKFDLL